MAVTVAKIRMGAATSMLFGGTDLGASKGGMILKYSPKFMDIKCDQVLAPVAAFRSEEECTLDVGLYQFQMSLIAIAFAVSSLGDVTTTVGTPNTDKLTFGGRVPVTTVTFDSTIPKNDGTTNNLAFHLNKIYSSKETALNFARDKETEYKTVMQALADPTQPAGQQLGYITEQY